MSVRSCLGQGLLMLIEIGSPTAIDAGVHLPGAALEWEEQKVENRQRRQSKRPLSK